MLQKIQNILGYKILELDNFSLSVYNIIILIVIIVLSRLFIRLIKLFLQRFIQRKAKESNASKLSIEGRTNALLQIVKYVVYILAVFSAIKSLGIDISLLLAGSAALFVGLGFGLQDAFKDLISGVIIMFEGNIKSGDIIEIDGLVGIIMDVKLRTSVVKTRAEVHIIVPNSKIVNEKVINWSSRELATRFTISVGVAYGSDVSLVKKILLEAASSHKNVLKRPKPIVIFNDFGDSSLDFNIYFWVNHYIWEIAVIKSDIRYKINQLFIENKVTIPFPQRDVHLFKAGE